MSIGNALIFKYTQDVCNFWASETLLASYWAVKLRCDIEYANKAMRPDTDHVQVRDAEVQMPNKVTDNVNQYFCSRKIKENQNMVLPHITVGYN